MRKQAQLILYGAVAALIVAAFVASPAAWATPSRRAMNQTVPTRTPTQEYVPTDLPTEPPATAQPGATETPRAADATPAPQASPAVSASTPTLPRLVLAVEPTRIPGWPGGLVEFTVRVSNAGDDVARAVRLDLSIPGALQLVDVSPAVAAEGAALVSRMERLNRGESFTHRFTFRVAPDATGPAVVMRPTLTAAGGFRASVPVVIALPPDELPPTGGQ